MTDTSGIHSVEVIHPRSFKYLSDRLTVLVRGRLWLQVLIGLILGLATGFVLGPSMGWLPRPTVTAITSWVALPGQLFLALIQMIVIPLVFASIIRGLAASESINQLRSLGVRVILYFVATTTMAITIGLALALIIQPGQYIDSELLTSTVGAAAPTEDAALSMPALSELPKLVLTFLPTNPLSSMAENDMLRVVVFSVVVGIALVLMPPTQSKPLLDLLGSLQAVCMTVVRWAMLLAPFAVFGLITQLAARTGLEALTGLAVYVLTVLLGLLCLFLAYLTIVALVARHNPIAFIKGIRELMLLAFSTSSSAAVMPLSIKTAEEKLGVRPSISQFIVPIGATINMDGTALYQGVAAVFLSQVFGIEIGVTGMLLILLTSVGASIGTPSTPGVGIVVLSMVVASVGVPPAGIALILGVDRILDMSRTTLNVTGDMVSSLVMNKWVGGERPLRLELAAEAHREELREKTGQDIIITSGKSQG